MTWLTDTGALLDDENALLETDAEKLRSQLHRHRELQRNLGAKQPTYDGVIRLGRTLHDKSELARRSRGSTILEEPATGSVQTIQVYARSVLLLLQYEILWHKIESL